MPDLKSIRKIIGTMRQRTCKHCLKEYTLGIDGVDSGCDECEGIVRLPNGMIDYSASSPEQFIFKQDEQS